MKSCFKVAACLALAAVATGPQVAAAQAAPATAPAPSPESLAVAREIVEIAWPPAKRQETMDGIMKSILAQYRASLSLGAFDEPGLKAILDDYFNSIPAMLRPSLEKFLPNQMEAIAAAYARTFPLQQLKDIRTFAQSESGRDFLERSTSVMSDPGVAAANTAYFKEVQAVTEQEIPKLKAKVVAYMAAHPEAAAKVKTPPATQ